MLVLTRKPGETVIIGGDIRLTVVSLGPGRVKIGVEAPKWMTVDRGEVHERKVAEDRATTEVEVDLPVELLSEGATVRNRIADKLPPASPPAGGPSDRLPRKPR
ncbi:MAG TPA: carbon storage regulator [Fimbriiglobus sp.]|jgi:carbon storage regulator